MTLVSILYFVEKKVDYVVYEVGLGGKLDATNLWSQPEATFITSI
jgi:dihydrofolate synthase/folylpolyglutamate synthase